MKILIVEDEIRIREGLRKLLNKINPEYVVVGEAQDGEEGLNMCRDLHPDLIITDVQMPRMDGYEAAKRIRALEDKEKASVPIIAVTANAFEEDRKQALEAGMNSHLSKPYDIPKMLETLGEILHN